MAERPWGFKSLLPHELSGEDSSSRAGPPWFGFAHHKRRTSRGMNVSDLPVRWCCYLLICNDGRFYCGSTSSLLRRLPDHASGAGSKFTSRCKPIALVWFETHSDRSSATAREQQIKTWGQSKKKALADGRFQFPRAKAVWVSLDPPAPRLRAAQAAGSG